jgi:hypothetical protein
MKGFATIFMLFMLTVVTSTAFGQQKPASMRSVAQQDDDMNVENAGRPDRGNTMSEQKRAEISKKIEAVRIWRLTATLKLDSKTSAKLASLLSSLDQQRRAIQHEKFVTMRRLRSSLNSPKLVESLIRTDLDILEKNHQAMQELRNNEMSELKRLLTIEQRGRYVIFQNDFMHEMRVMLHNARGAGR